MKFMFLKNFFKKSLHRKIMVILGPLFAVAPLLIILIFLSRSASSSSVTLITEWGSSGTNDGQFSAPTGLAIDQTNNVYVADTNNDRIQKFDSSGNFLTQWGSHGSGDGQFDTPQGVAVDPSGNVYVTDSVNNRIEKFSSTGTYITQWGSSGSGDGQFDTPQGIAVDYLSNVYVADTDNNRVQKFTSSGTYITQWGSLGTSDGQFDAPQGIAVDPWSNVYVADTGNDRIETFDSTGSALLIKWGSSGSGDGQFSNPNSLAVDSSGKVYVSDGGNNRIQLFDNNGNYILKWGSAGSGDIQFNIPSGIALNSSSDIFVLDKNNNRVQEFSTSFDLGVYSSTVNPNTFAGTNDVYALLQVGTTLYLGGAFGLQAVDMDTGDQISWNSPGTSSAVLSLAYFNDKLYAGTQNGILSFDTSTSTGTLTGWTPNFGGNSVKALTVVSGTLYAGGTFTSVDAQPRVGLAAFNISTPTGVLTSWTKNIDSGKEVDVLKGVATDLYVGGTFTTVGGTSQPALAKIDTSSGNLDGAFVPVFDTAEFPHVNAILASDTNIYVGGFFTTINTNAVFTNLASLDSTTGDPDTAWTPSTAFNVSALTANNGYLYVGEDGTSDGEALVYKLSSGDIVDWAPPTDQPITSMLATDALYVGLKTVGVGSLIKRDKFASLDFHLPVAYAASVELSEPKLLANLDGHVGTIFLAQFDAFSAPTATPTLLPTSTPTQTPTPGPSTPTPTGTLTPSPTPTVSSSSSGTLTSAQLTQGAAATIIAQNLAAQNNGKLPASGPSDIINLGVIGFILLIVGAGLLFL